MRHRRRFFAGAASIVVGLAWLLPAAIPANAAAVTLTIGIDNAPPAGHNWEFLDYFPNGGVNVHNGDTVHFKFNTASLDGFHTATLGKVGESLQSVAANNPALTPDSDTGDPAGQQQFTTAFAPTNPPAGSGAPGACGDVTTPCPYDGTAYESSGAMFPGGPFGTEFFVRVQLGSSPTQPSLVNYICRVHGPAMSASFTIVPDASTASTQSSLDTAATAQYNSALAAGQAATSAVTAASTSTNANGTHTIAMHAGTESPDGRVQVLEMLPSSVNITAGDTINWTTLSRNDPHTVTFPSPPGNGFDPFPAYCEGATGDTPDPTFNPAACAGGPPNFEIHYAPQPIGPTVIATSTTQASSGVITAGSLYASLGPSYSFTFPNAGTFAYTCAIHNHMTGQVLAASVTPPPALPKAGVPMPGSTRLPLSRGTLILATAMLIMAAASVVTLAKRPRRS
jgi:plastocyanin